MATVGRLAAGVAHEINNPIGVILGYVQVMLQQTKAGDSQHEDLKTLEEEALQCKRIVQDLLDLTRPMRIDAEVFDVREVIHEVVDRVHRQEAFGQVAMDIQLPPQPLLVSGDRAKIRQVVTNLVSNGVEAMPEGGKLTVRGYACAGSNSSPPGADGEFAVIEVADTGCGITPENRNRLFEPFFSTKRNGTGLGLAISYGIVKAHNGFIDVESQPGRGTTFSVRLPARG
jgi:signal transduction histidine kinase